MLSVELCDQLTKLNPQAGALKTRCQLQAYLGTICCSYALIPYESSSESDTETQQTHSYLAR